MKTKYCGKCSLKKSLSEFSKNKSKVDNLQTNCRKCQSIMHNIYGNAVKPKIIEQTCSECGKTKSINMFFKKRQSKYGIRNECKRCTQDKKNERLDNNPEARLIKNQRHRLYKAIKNGYKSDTTKKLLGCDEKKLKNHLELLFKPGMTWKNYGMGGWAVDHIIACCKFDLTDPEQQKKCFNYKNLQPLWWDENLQKSGN